MASRGSVLSMEGVSLSFGDKRVLDGLTFSVARGECFGFLGPSGAGKTTTIKLLTSASGSSRTRARSTSA